MTPNQFYDLDEAEQAEAIWDGKHVGSREDELHNILLYKIGDLFVEVFHHKEYNKTNYRKFNGRISRIKK